MPDQTAYTLLRTDRFVFSPYRPPPGRRAGHGARTGLRLSDDFIDAVVPADIRLPRPLDLPPGRSEREVLQASSAGWPRRTGSSGPTSAWGTARDLHAPGHPAQHPREPGLVHRLYPYQAEIAQGRLEALLNFQTWWPISPACRVANASPAR